MPTPVSALESRPEDLVREVSPAAITFYADELSGIYLPEDFKAKHADVLDVKYWKPEDRLAGKFGRYALSLVHENDGEEPLDPILAMGTTIGLTGLDRYGDLESLRHFMLDGAIRGILEQRDLLGKRVSIDRMDYGATRITLDETGKPVSVSVSSASVDFGRADAEGRQETCDLFTQALGEAIGVVNVDPEPREYERIVEP